jgi:hypothetical protein
MSEVDQLKERILFLEQQMRDLRSAVNGSSSLPGWKRKIGLFADDEAFAEIVRLGAKIRREGYSNEPLPASRNRTKAGKKRGAATPGRGAK